MGIDRAAAACYGAKIPYELIKDKLTCNEETGNLYLEDLYCAQDVYGWSDPDFVYIGEYIKEDDTFFTVLSEDEIKDKIQPILNKYLTTDQYKWGVHAFMEIS